MESGIYSILIFFRNVQAGDSSVDRAVGQGDFNGIARAQCRSRCKRPASGACDGESAAHGGLRRKRVDKHRQRIEPLGLHTHLRAS